MCEAEAEAEAEALRRFLERHPALRLLPPGDRVRCALTGHELPCRLPALRAYAAGKKYRRLSGAHLRHDAHDDAPAGLGLDLDLSAYEPHLVPSARDPAHQLFCRLTLRHINRIPAHVLRHVQGRRYRKALARYEECQKEGVDYVPTSLQQKRRRRRQEAQSEGSRPRPPRREKGGFWEPPASDASGSETEDSMSDLYPAELFPEKSPAGKETNPDLTTDSDEEAAKPATPNGACSEDGEAMDVDPQTGTKRGKKQGGGLKKRFKSRNRKPKKFGKAVSGKQVLPV